MIDEEFKFAEPTPPHHLPTLKRWRHWRRKASDHMDMNGKTL